MYVFLKILLLAFIVYLPVVLKNPTSTKTQDDLAPKM
jgi:hypothetical protein